LLENYVSIAFLRPPNVVAKGLPSPLYIPRVGQQRNSHNLRNVHPVQAVCEFVRIKSSHAFAAARFCPTSVSRIRVSSRQHSKSTSLRGWRSQDRGGSSPLFRTTPTACGAPRGLQALSLRASRSAVGHESPLPHRASGVLLHAGFL
jgi:hypothetical protein